MSDAVMRAARIEVQSFSNRQSRQRWVDLALQSQEYHNAIWQTWLCWHIKNGTRQKLRSYLDILKAWHAEDTKTRGRKPRSDMQAVPKELAAEIYVIGNEFPALHIRCRSLIQNQVICGIKKRKSAKGSLPGWMSILLFRENIPTFRDFQPLFFDRQNSQLMTPEKRDEPYTLRVRMLRGEDGTSEVDELKLRTVGRRRLGARITCDNITAGDWSAKGSKLYWNAGRKKWFVLLSYEKPKEQPKLKANSILIIRAGRHRPWQFAVYDGESLTKTFLRGNYRDRHVDYIARQRGRLLSRRRALQENYKCSSQSGQGHGRYRSIMRWKGPLEQVWNGFVKNVNERLTADIVRLCVRRGISRVIYLQPTGAFGESRCLQTAGRPQGVDLFSGWQWHQVATRLNDKCVEHGINCEVKKSEWPTVKQLEMAG